MADTPQYIQIAAETVMQAIARGNERISLSMAIGQVSSIVQIIQAYCLPAYIDNKRVLIATERRDLADTLQDRLDSIYNSKVQIAISTKELTDTPIVIATVQKLAGMVQGLEFDLIFLLGCESVFGRNVQEVKLIISRGKIVIGIDYSFKNSLPYLGAPVFRYSLGDAIEDRMLVPIKINVVRLNKSLLKEDNLKSDSEYEIEDYNFSVNNLERIRIIADSILKVIDNEKTVVFCNSQEEATKLSDALNSMAQRSISFPAISGKLKDVPRIIRQFVRDETPVVLTSVDLLYSGMDLPNIKNIVLLRYTKSATILSQILITGCRLYKDKEYLKVYDYVGVFEQQKIFEEVMARGIPNDPHNEKKDELPPEANKSDNKTQISKTAIIFRDRQHVNGVLGVKEIAEELAEIIKILPGERGSMIGIFGKWGRGKTFLMQEVWNKLDDGKKNERIDFHAWKYQDTPASWAYLYEVLLYKYTKAEKKRKGVRWAVKIFRILRLNFNRNGFLPILKFLIIISFSTALWLELHYYAVSQSQALKNIITILGLTSSLAVLYKLASYLKTKYETAATSLFLKYSKKHSFKEHLGLQAEIQKELITLLKTWIPEKYTASRKIIIFVDDIDRCSEHKIIQLIDSLRVMLEDEEVAKRVVVITAIDERILKYAIRSKYHSILKEGEALNINALTKEYFDKLFIIGVKLGDLSSQERDEFFLEFIKDDIKALEKNEEVNIDITNDDLMIGEVNRLDQTDRNTQSVTDNSNGNFPIKTVGKSITIEAQITRVDKLYPEEIAILRSCLKNYDNATPRQIRIFYYRFLLAKNLLIKQYSLLGRSNIWLTPPYNEVFIKLIIVYSQQEDALFLSQHKVEILHAKTPEVKVFLLEDITVSVSDYGELLKALDIVLAY